MNFNLTVSTACSDMTEDLVMSPGCAASSAKFEAMPSPNPVPKRTGLRFEGHRGAGALEPENSLKAFQRAIDLGIDGVELDVWVSKDGVPIVVHGTDEGVIHFKDNTSTIYAFDVLAEDLKKMRLPNDETIPTLEEVLLLCKDRIHVNIELKEESYRVIKPTLELVQRMDMFDQVCFSSFVHKHKQNVEDARKELSLERNLEFGFLVWTLQDFETYLQVASVGDALNIDIELLLRHEAFVLEHMDKARAKNMKIKFYFGFESEETHDVYKRLEELRVDTLIINHPLKSVDFLTQATF